MERAGVQTVRLVRSGGFGAFAPTVVELKAADLSAAEASELQRKLEAASFFQLPAVLPQRGGVGAADAFEYELSIASAAGLHRVRASDGSASEALLDLVDYVLELGDCHAG
jgi:Emfourin